MKSATLRFLCCALLALLAAGPIFAQGHPISARGLTAQSTYSSDGIDAVNNFNRSLTLAIPFGSYPLSTHSGYGLSLYYTSQVWDLDFIPSGCNLDNTPCLRTEPDASSNAGLGWYLSLGKLLTPGDRPANESDRYVYVGPDGGRHYFYDTLHEGEPTIPSADCDKDGCDSQFTRDGSYLRLKKVAKNIEFPDGSIHTFLGEQGELTRIQDGFGNYVNVGVPTPLPSATTTSWTISDQFLRSHFVNFTKVNGLYRVSSVDLAAFNGGRAVYTFNYATSTMIFRPYMDTDDLNSAQVPVDLLTSISGPEGISYSMTQGGLPAYYLGTSNTNAPTGQLKSLELPTKGTIAWEYDETHYPVSSSLGYFENGFGVSKKTTASPWGSGGIWTYATTLVGPTPSTELKTTVVDPANVRHVYYFSTPTTTSTAGWTGWEYGLPFTARLSDGGRYLSSETLNSLGTRVRSTWLNFSHDQLSASASPADWYNSNRRVTAARTKFDDDTIASFSERSFGNFDGLGHYRDTTLQGTFDSAVSRTETAQFNPTRGCYGVNLSTNAQLCTGVNAFVPFADLDKWILGTLSYTQQSEGTVTARQEMSFSSTTGFLDCVRALKSGTTRNINDLVVTFGNDGAGNAAFEKYWGGDLQILLTGSTCATATSPAYWIEHAFASGAMATARYRISAATPMNFFSFNATIDNNTGLVRNSYDESGFLTKFTRDTLSRVTLVEPNGSTTAEKEAKTSISYSNATASVPAKVNVYRSCPTPVPPGCSGSFGESETHIDGFGRPWKELVRQADGSTWARRETGYNALGWRTSFSELGANTGSLFWNTLSGFDSFGRPGLLAKADGKTVTFTYAGAREFTRRTTVSMAPGPTEADSYTTEGYDAFGRLRRVWEPSMPSGGNVNTNYLYDVGNRLKEVDQVAGTNHQHRYLNFDNRGFLISESHPEKGGNVGYSSYDARGHAREIQDGATTGRNLLFSFDSAERLLNVTEGGTGGRLLKEFSYGSSGNGLGKLLSAKRHNYLGAPFNTDYLVAESYEYNGIGRRPSKRTTQLTIFGAIQERFEQSWTYDRGGNTATIGYPVCFAATCPALGTTPRTTSYTVANGYLTAIPGWASAISYQLNGLLNTVSFANNISQVVLNDPNRIPRPQDIQYKVTSSQALIGSLGPYEYDGSGNIKKLNGLDFTYDLASRLKSGAVYVAGIQKGASATYDGYGNLTSITTNGAQRNTPTSVSSNRLTSGVYDVGGNLTNWNGAAYGYDRLNMPTQICSSGTLAACTGENWLFAYTADDERILEYRIGGGAFRTSLRDLSGKILREYRVEAAANWSSFEDFIYRDSTLLASVHPTEGTRWFGPDHLGTPRAVFNSAGSVIALHTYYPFGEEATASTQDTQQTKFTGHERDALGTTGTADDTDYMHARQFSIQTGRFMSCDPLLGNPRSPQSWNLYSYVLGNPLKYVDPTGRCTQWVTILDKDGNEVGATCVDGIKVIAGKGPDPSSSNHGEKRKPLRENETRDCPPTSEMGPFQGLAGLLERLNGLSVSGTASIYPIPVLGGLGLDANLVVRPDGSADLYVGAGLALGTSAVANPLSSSEAVQVAGSGNRIHGGAFRFAGAAQFFPPPPAAAGLAVRGSFLGDLSGSSRSAGFGAGSGISGSLTGGYVFQLVKPCR